MKLTRTRASVTVASCTSERAKPMTPKLLILFAAIAFSVTPRTGFAQLKKIRFSASSIAVTELQFKIAQAKGFYRDEGLEVETILIRGAVGLQALLGGSVDYSSAAGALVAAAVRGAPVRLVMVVNSKPQFDLVALPEIKSVPQLKGKVVGISSRGGAVDLLTQAILSQHGLTPNKDVTLLVIGTPEEMMIALRNRLIAGCLLTPPRPLILAREGFNKIAYSGDYLTSYPSGGVGATEEKIRTHPAEVFAFIRGSLRGLQYYVQNRADSIENIAKFLNIKDPALAAETYDVHVSRLGGTAYLNDAWMRGAIEFTKKSLGATNDVPPNRVFDFSFVERALGKIKG